MLPVDVNAGNVRDLICVSSTTSFHLLLSPFSFLFYFLLCLLLWLFSFMPPLSFFLDSLYDVFKCLDSKDIWKHNKILHMHAAIHINTDLVINWGEMKAGTEAEELVSCNPLPRGAHCTKSTAISSLGSLRPQGFLLYLPWAEHPPWSKLPLLSTPIKGKGAVHYKGQCISLRRLPL